MAALTENDFTTNEWVGCGGLHMVPLCQQLIENLLAPGQRRLLDIGCGCGAIGIALLEQGTISELVMTDIDATSVNFATQNIKKILPPEKQLAARAYVADVWNVATDTLPEQPFDVIICNAPLSEELPRDDKVNPYRFFNDGWKFQRQIFAGLYSYLNRGGIVIIKDLFGANWRFDFPIDCIATVVGNEGTLQKSTQFFVTQGVNVFPVTSQLVNDRSHCLRIFQRAV